MTSDFPQWLSEQLDIKAWNKAELSRRSGVSAPQITRIMNREQSPGKESLIAIARALHLPQETVFRAAGMLPPVPARNEQIERIMNYLDTLPESELDRIEIQIAALSQRRVKTGKTGPLRGKP